MRTKIAWTDYSFNPWWGCVRVSPGCERCYAESFAKRTGNAVWGAQAPRRFFGDKHWAEPYKWNLAAFRAGIQAKVFCASMADVFEVRSDPARQAELNFQRERLWAVIDTTPSLVWQLLTKRPENILTLVPTAWLKGFPPNVWIGTTVENQKSADTRIMPLLSVPARVRFLSMEPLLEAVDIRAFLGAWPRSKWVIVGGESGPGARPFKLDWAHDVVGQCKAVGVAVFVKQLGAQPWPTVSGTELPPPMRLQDRKGGDWDEWPEDLRVREFPAP